MAKNISFRADSTMNTPGEFVDWGMLTPEAVFPCQLPRENSHAISPEKKLARQIFWDALEDLKHSFEVTEERSGKIRPQLSYSMFNSYYGYTRVCISCNKELLIDGFHLVQSRWTKARYYANKCRICASEGLIVKYFEKTNNTRVKFRLGLRGKPSFERREVLDWFFSDIKEEEQFLSFSMICELLNLNTSIWRNRIEILCLAWSYSKGQHPHVARFNPGKQELERKTRQLN